MLYVIIYVIIGVDVMIFDVTGVILTPGNLEETVLETENTPTKTVRL